MQNKVLSVGNIDESNIHQYLMNISKNIPCPHELTSWLLEGHVIIVCHARLIGSPLIHNLETTSLPKSFLTTLSHDYISLC